jgi:Protein of unknown function (DUF2723)
MTRHKSQRGKTRDERVAPRRGRSEALPEAPPASRPWLGPLVTFALLLVLYVATLAPSVVGGDSGELTAAALTGGVPHPPGYPLFALLARALAGLPLGHVPAWRVNLLSAVSMAAAAALLCALVQRWTRDTVAALVAAALFGADPVVWLHATGAEVFGLHAFFVALALWLWFRIERTAAPRYVLALAFASGLAMCNQQTFLFIGLPLLGRALWIARHGLGVRGVVLALLAGLLGLAPYAYLQFASGSSAAVSWGDETSVAGLLAHILRRDYGTLSLGHAIGNRAFADEGTFFPTLGSMLGLSFPRLAWIGPALAAAGFYLGAKNREDRAPTLLLAVVLCLYVLLFCSLANLSSGAVLYAWVVSRFFIQSDLLLAVALGLGVANLLPRLYARLPVVTRHPSTRFLVPGLVFVLAVLAHHDDASQRGNRVFPDFARTTLTSLAPNAIVITTGDHVGGAFSYLHDVEQLRPDVVHLDRELLSFAWYCQRKRRAYPDLVLPDAGYSQQGWNIRQLLEGNPTRPVFVVDKLDTWDTSWQTAYRLVPQGLVHALVPTSRRPSFEEWTIADRRALVGYDVLPALRSHTNSWEQELGRLVLTTQGMRAQVALAYSLDRGKDPSAARVCVSLIEDLIGKTGGDSKLNIPGQSASPTFEVSAGAWKDLGVCYEILSRVEPSYGARVPVAVERFAERAAPDDADLPAARRFLEMHRAHGDQSPASGAISLPASK